MAAMETRRGGEEDEWCPAGCEPEALPVCIWRMGSWAHRGFGLWRCGTLVFGGAGDGPRSQRNGAGFATETSCLPL